MYHGEKIMRHILTILLVGVLILSGLGAGATSAGIDNEDSQILNDESNNSIFNDELEIEITGGFGIHLIIRNIGDNDVSGVEFDVTVTGGILDMIHDHYDGIISSIPFGSEFSLDIPIFGFGPIDITATVEENTINAKGFILFFFVLIIT